MFAYLDPDPELVAHGHSYYLFLHFTRCCGSGHTGFRFCFLFEVLDVLFEGWRLLL